MSIFDIFSLRKNISKIFTKENFIEVLTKAKEAIKAQVMKQITGAEKKAIVDEVVTNVIKSKTEGCDNKTVLWLVDRVIDFVPTVTQFIYDTLKETVENL